MKYHKQVQNVKDGLVTLYVRVWIEMSRCCSTGEARVVTLYVRVWIEMMYTITFFPTIYVTLYVRVWIEIVLLNGELGIESESPST